MTTKLTTKLPKVGDKYTHIDGRPAVILNYGDLKTIVNVLFLCGLTYKRRYSVLIFDTFFKLNLTNN